MWEELENALAWYSAAPARWIDSVGDDLEAAAQWIWEVLQGDFNEEQSKAQMITGMVISMLPLADQLCDVRDVVANSKKINEDTSNKWAWIGLVLTLIGLFPVLGLGSLAKGCLKILFASSRKGVLRVASNTVDTNLWKHTAYYVEYGIDKLNQHLDKPIVRQTLKALKIFNPYQYLADKVRQIAGKLSVGALMQALDLVIGTLRELLDLIKRWGSQAMASQAGELLQTVMRIRNMANAKLSEVLAPVKQWLDKLARRLEVEADASYAARVNAINPHHFKRVNNEAELEKFRKDKPEWVDETDKLSFEAAKKAPAPKQNFPDIGDTAPMPLDRAYKTFHGTINPVTYPPGTVLYRVVDPASNDNSFCWMSKAEFEKLKSKAEWRRYFAVKGPWNANGEYVTYTVPPGAGLNAWEGVVASQVYENSAEQIEYVLEGGARQIVLDPSDLDLDPKYLGKRRPTGWGYSTLGESVSLVGVPVLKHNIHAAKQ